MFHTKLASGLLALTLSVPFAHAQPVAPATTTVKVSADAVDPDSVEALKRMGTYLQSLKRFQVTIHLSSEKVLLDEQKLQRSTSATLQVLRPNKLKATMSSAVSERELFYDGKHATLYTPAMKYYGTTEAADTIGGMIDQLEARYGVELPLADLFLWGTPAAPIDQIESAMNAGQSVVAGVLCDHYAFRQGKVDWQIWISAGNQPLPRKIVITNRRDDARPQSISLLSWDLKPAFKDTVFIFTPPKGAISVGIRPLDAK